MIGRIQGILLEKQVPDLLIDVGGVGYEVLAPMSTCFRLPATGEQVLLHTHFVVREDAQLLYGFADKNERQLFRELIKVNGVGPKLALAILSGMDVDGFIRCVHEGDTASLVKLPGVGKKTAERLLIEMKDRLKAWELPASLPAATLQEQHAAADFVADAESALVALGYKPQEASRAIAKVQADDIDNSEELIRRALKNMVGQG